MNKKNEMIKQKISEVAEIEEQQFYEDMRMILQQVREQTYSNAGAIMTYQTPEDQCAPYPDNGKSGGV